MLEVFFDDRKINRLLIDDFFRPINSIDRYLLIFKRSIFLENVFTCFSYQFLETTQNLNI